MILYIKYGELTLKGKNRHFFVDALFTNVMHILRKYESIKFHKMYDAISITNIEDDNIDEICNLLLNVSGISLIIKAFEVEKDILMLTSKIIKELPKSPHTFKVNTRRSDKNYPFNSMEINKEIGGMILNNLANYKVDIHNPQITINIEIKKETAIFYFNKIKGLGGLPLGTGGKVLLLISGGIDSPVAAKLLLKKGFRVDFLTFITPPHTNPKSLEKVKKLIDVITIDKTLYVPKLYICNFTNIQHELSHIVIKAYQITLMRRYFFRIAKKLAQEKKYLAIATGESLGQVASQTIESMQTIQNAIKDFLVLRPLLTFDKSEIISLAIKFNTYDISIEPYIDCCALFVPKNPATKPTIKTAEELEQKLEFVEDL
jgi:thiamine biosynthesis protein ThiI